MLEIGDKRIVAIEVEDRKATILYSVEGGLESEDIPFSPWLLAAERRDIGAYWKEFKGEGHRWLARFQSWNDFRNGRDLLRKAGISIVSYNDPVKQFCLWNNDMSMFGGMAYQDLNRMQLDIETTTLDPEDEDARILMIALKDTIGNEEVLIGKEEEILKNLTSVVRFWNPDVIEGHNLLSFDLPYLDSRAKLLKIPLKLGRDNSELEVGHEAKCPIGPIKIAYRRCHVWGRHCIDTLIGVRRFDMAKGELESYGLKEVASHYKLSSEDRVYIDRGRVVEAFNQDPERVRKYALHDVEETGRLSALVMPTEFYQTQFLPDSYQNVCVTGNGEKLNSLLVREYLNRQVAVPFSNPTREYVGAHTEIRRTGVIHRVVKADVESLYPNIMLNYKVKPKSDTENVFLPMLATLTRKRLEAKAMVKKTSGLEKEYYDGLQTSFKYAINSFYGYLGAGNFFFNDAEAAEKVTTTGQDIVKAIDKAVEEFGGSTIEIDTDGVFFTVPEDCETEEEEEAFIKKVESRIPKGFKLAHDGRYRTMISLRMKNYVLQEYDGKVKFKGASLRSRADELYGREFIKFCVNALLNDDLRSIQKEYLRVQKCIMEGNLELNQISRRERITDKTLNSKAKERLRANVGDLKLGDNVWVYEKKDGTLGNIEEYQGDINHWYYVNKLRSFADRFEPVLGKEVLDALCPEMKKKSLGRKMSGQLSLFEE